MAQNKKVQGIATTISADAQNRIVVTYHQTRVVEVALDGTITLNTDGYKTVTTKRRMNQAANQFGLGYEVSQKDFDWFVTYKGETFPFLDRSITLSPDGINRDWKNDFKRGVAKFNEPGCDCIERSWYGVDHDTACPLFKEGGTQ